MIVGRAEGLLADQTGRGSRRAVLYRVTREALSPIVLHEMDVRLINAETAVSGKLQSGDPETVDRRMVSKSALGENQDYRGRVAEG